MVVAATSGLGLATVLQASLELTAAQVSKKKLLHLFKESWLSVSVLGIPVNHQSTGVTFCNFELWVNEGVFVSAACPRGYYGKDCTKLCSCGEGGQCHPTTGRCMCAPGRMGQSCQQGNFKNWRHWKLMLRACDTPHLFLCIYWYQFESFYHYGFDQSLIKNNIINQYSLVESALCKVKKVLNIF